MKKKMIMILLACTMLATGCGSEEAASSRVTYDPNSVECILQQGLEDKEAEAEIAEAEPAAEEPEIFETAEEAETAEEPAAEPVADEEVDVDLTALSSTMVYSEVSNMMTRPDDYIGKKIKMDGMLSVFYDESTGKTYYACIIADATACCSQGIEFELTDNYSYPEDYPEPGEEICVAGVFDTYKEGEYTYCTLRNAGIIN